MRPEFAAELVVAAVIGAGVLAPAARVRWAVALVVPAGVLVAAALWGPAPGAGNASSDVEARVTLAAITAALLVGGSLGGAIVGARVRKAGYLIVVAYVSSLADVYSVLASGGPSAHVAQSERALSVLAVSWGLPALGGGVAPVPIIGVGDVVMTALYLVAARQLGLGVRRTVVAIAVGYLVVAALLVVFAQALPALPVLGVAVLLAHPEARRIPPEDRRTAWIGMAALTALFALLWVVG